MADYNGGVTGRGTAPKNLAVPRSAALAALLRGSGAYTGVWERFADVLANAADPLSGAAQAVDISGPAPEIKAALTALYNANTGNPAAPLLLGIINQM